MSVTSPSPIYEGSDCFFTATYADIYNVPYVPTAVQYQIDDLTNDVNVLPPTAYSTQAGPSNNYTDTIDIPGALNAIAYPGHSQELRQITIRVTAPGGAVRVDYTTYSVVSLEDMT